MGLIELLIYIVVVVLIGWLAIWVLGQLAPGHPAVIDKIIWVVVVLIVVLVLVRAFGIVDPAGAAVAVTMPNLPRASRRLDAANVATAEL